MYTRQTSIGHILRDLLVKNTLWSKSCWLQVSHFLSVPRKSRTQIRPNILSSRNSVSGMWSSPSFSQMLQLQFCFYFPSGAVFQVWKHVSRHFPIWTLHILQSFTMRVFLPLYQNSLENASNFQKQYVHPRKAPISDFLIHALAVLMNGQRLAVKVGSWYKPIHFLSVDASLQLCFSPGQRSTEDQRWHLMLSKTLTCKSRRWWEPSRRM